MVLSLSAFLFICLFQAPLSFPFLLPLCIPWTFCFCSMVSVFIMNVISFFPPFNQSLYHQFFFPCVSTSPCRSLTSGSSFPSLPSMLLFSPRMNGVFAEECSGLLPGQRAAVSPQPADLSPATVFMLRLVPQCSLPVVLPVFLFPSSSSSSPFGSHFTSEHDTRHAHATALPRSELAQIVENVPFRAAP